MSIRPGRAKGPWVGYNGSPISGDFVAVDGTDTTPGFLDVKLSAELGLEDNIRNPAGNEILEIDGLPGFRDDFSHTTIRPFWDGMPVLTSGDWQLDAINDTLDGIAQNNTKDAYRYGIEGDFDHAIKINRGSASSCGLYFDGNSIEVRFSFQAAQYIISATGEVTQNPVNSDTIQWLRVKRAGTALYFFAKALDTDSWTLLHTYTGIDLGHHVSASLESASTAEIHEVWFHDNTMPQRVRSDAGKVVSLTDGANIAVDASRANFFTVTLGGNRQLDNPSNAIDGQKIIIRVTQDVVGSRVLSFDTKYNFSTDLPSPTLSTGAGQYDYLGFIYNQNNDTWDYIAEVKGFS